MNGNMNGNPPSVAPTASTASTASAAANGQQPPVRRRRPRPQADVLRKPRRPLQNITKPLVSLSQMNEAPKKSTLARANGSQAKEELKQ